MSSTLLTSTTADPEAPLTAARQWMISAAVMVVTVTQVLDTTVTNVALPHIQGALSAAVDDVSWVLTSYLAANAVVLLALGCLLNAYATYSMSTVTLGADYWARA